VRDVEDFVGHSVAVAGVAVNRADREQGRVLSHHVFREQSTNSVFYIFVRPDELGIYFHFSTH
jgi:hypothetical protein